MSRQEAGYISPIKPANIDNNWRSKVKLHLIASLDEMKQVLLTCNTEDPLAVDTETTGLDYNTLDIVGFSFCFNSAEAYYVPVGHKIGANIEGALAEFISFMVNHKGKLLFYNFQYDGRVLRKYGLNLDKITPFDVMPLVWNVDTNIHMPSLKNSAKHYLGMDSQFYSDILGNAKDFSQLTPNQIYEYAALDAYFTMLLLHKLLPFYNNNKFIVDLDHALGRAMIEYEDTPLNIDIELVKSTQRALSSEVTKLEAEIYQIAGQYFKIGSPEVLSSILRSLGVDTGKTTARKGYMSTSIDDLEIVQDQHQIVPRLIQYKKLTKKLSTYVETMLLAHAAHPEGIRFQYQICNVPTGRFSSGVGSATKKSGQAYFAEINIQSIPKPGASLYRAELSSDSDAVFGWKFTLDPQGIYEAYEEKDNVRKFFIPYPDHYVVALDFVMEELVVAANLSRDPAFLEPIKKGEDLHMATARFMFEPPIDKSLRKIAKIANFGLLYGGNDYTLHNAMPDKTVEECREYYSKWVQLHHHLWNSYMPRVKASARQKGFTTNAFGRIRRVAYWYALGNPRDEAFADRTVWNNQVQGTCGDVMRVALVRIYKHLIKNPKYKGLIKFMGTVHDELVFSITKDPVMFNEIIDIVVKDMTQLPFKWEIPLSVGIAIGNSWGSVFEFERKDGVWFPEEKSNG